MSTPYATPEERPLKSMKPQQTNCDEKDEKGKPCWGPLKIWYTAPAEIRQKVPEGMLLYRCQACATLYYGPPRELPLRRRPRRISILGW